MADLTVKWRKPTGDLCEFCGTNKPDVVILDPNKFPDNDLEEKEDTWDVCNTCKDFISEEVLNYYMKMAMGIMKGGKKDDKNIPGRGSPSVEEDKRDSDILEW